MIIIFKIVILLISVSVFYLVFFLNISLLKLSAIQESLTKTISLIILILILVIGIILFIIKSKLPYNFYRNKISAGNKVIYYTEIINTVPYQDQLDKIFNSYSINLGPHFSLRHVPQKIQLENYIKKLIHYNQLNH